MPSVGILGGTFDPIHHGHLRSAVELRELLGVSELRLMPSHQPPLRDDPGASSELRLAMVEAAIDGEPGLAVESREMRRSGPSYSADTLAELRRECGPSAPLLFIVGSDAFNQLHRWHDWQGIFASAHLVVMERPDFPMAPDAEVAQFLARRWADDTEALLAQPGGQALRVQLCQLAISATDIRQRIAQGRSVRYLLPEGVRQIINEQGLYRAGKQETQS
ncbi:nicotinate-nucleotide adenylyltransferase [Spongiibacter taiwanensis]